MLISGVVYLGCTSKARPGIEKKALRLVRPRASRVDKIGHLKGPRTTHDLVLCRSW